MGQLAAWLHRRGLNTMSGADESELVVTNPISAQLKERIRYEGDSYVTSWGYELGQVGDEQRTADRLAYLLGAPTQRSSPSGGPEHGDCGAGRGLGRDPEEVYDP